MRVLLPKDYMLLPQAAQMTVDVWLEMQHLDKRHVSAVLEDDDANTIVLYYSDASRLTGTEVIKVDEHFPWQVLTMLPTM